MSQATHFYAQRLKVVQQKIKANEAYLVSKATDITHFTGFPQLVPEEREALLLVTSNKAFLFHHNFSPTLSNFSELNYIPQTNLKKIETVCQQEQIKQLWIDEKTLVAEEFSFFRQIYNQENLKTLPHNLIWQLRLTKDELALNNQRQAGQIIAQVFTLIPAWLNTSLTEKQLAGKIIGQMMELGAETVAFPTIVAFGGNGALPHHQPTDQKLEKNQAVLIDAGAKFNGYRSDMTRTFWFGDQPSQEFLNIETIVKQAYQQAVTLIATGPNGHLVKDLDQAARNYIEQQGFGDEFIHTTGHGIGLDIHEPPSISWLNKEPLIANMTFTIEPGIYLLDKFGYRFENTIYLTTTGYQELTQP
ncbi:MAG: M24 family metallopeptidase [Patescibacteria group bacterium]